MRRIYHRYEVWEDYQCGMFIPSNRQDDPKKIYCAKMLLSECDTLLLAMQYVATNWRYAAEHNLTNMSRNRQAWLGQAACCYVHRATEMQTKSAWHELAARQQDEANAVADRVIEEWEVVHAEKTSQRKRVRRSPQPCLFYV